MKYLLVCSVGGHLAQLRELSRRFIDPAKDEQFWVTHDTSQSRSLLEGERRVFLPYISERDISGVIKAIPTARRIMIDERPDIVVSTGSAIALTFLPLARLRRVRAVFIESAAMVYGRTRTGSALQYVPGVECYSQSPLTATGRWRLLGSVFDGFEAEQTAVTHFPKRIVVTVGTSVEFGFRTLLERVANVVPDDVDVLWQTGQTDVSGLDIDARPWLPAADLEAAMHEADVVISHAGGGSALTAIIQGKRPILVARRASAGDFNDDHQTELVRQLTERCLAFEAKTDTLCWDDVVEATGWRVKRETASQPISLVD